MLWRDSFVRNSFLRLFINASDSDLLQFAHSKLDFTIAYHCTVATQMNESRHAKVSVGRGDSSGRTMEVLETRIPA